MPYVQRGNKYIHFTLDKALIKNNKKLGANTIFFLIALSNFSVTAKCMKVIYVLLPPVLVLITVGTQDVLSAPYAKSF